MGADKDNWPRMDANFLRTKHRWLQDANITGMYIDDVSNMTGEERLKLACLLSALEREILKGRLHEENPRWSEMRVKIELIRIAFLPKPLPKWLEKRFMEDCDEFRTSRRAE